MLAKGLPSVPVSLYDFLVKLISDLGECQSVAIVQNDAQLTTVEVAGMLKRVPPVSHRTTGEGRESFHMVGTHRRIYGRDVLAYKMQRDGKRRRILDDLTCAEAAEGLYDRAPPDDHAD